MIKIDFTTDLSENTTWNDKRNNASGLLEEEGCYIREMVRWNHSRTSDQENYYHKL